jgi:hypothetical protein
MNTVLPGFGIAVTDVNCWKTDEILAEIDKGLTLLYLESPTNPLLRVVDVPTLTSRRPRQRSRGAAGCHFCIADQPAPGAMGGRRRDSQRDQVPGWAPRPDCRRCLLQQPLRGPHLADLRKILGGIMDPMTAFPHPSRAADLGASHSQTE